MFVYTYWNYNGSYFHENASENRYCGPYQSFHSFYNADWRNRILSSIFPQLYETKRVIEIATALYTQWEVHNGLFNHLVRPGSAAVDCTHYCHGSGVFQLVTSSILGSVLHFREMQ